jgi:hypothetical protein
MCQNYDGMSWITIPLIRSYLKKFFFPNLCVRPSFQVLDILKYACGLKLGPALTLSQNPIFEMASSHQAFGVFGDCAETPGILHMALTHGVMIYYVSIRLETAGEKQALIPPNRAVACFNKLNLN